MKILNSIYKNIAGIFGDVKYFNYPLFLLYDPSDYHISYDDYKTFTSTLIRGDIILRTYDHYLDGAIIPGFYSHAALYLGDDLIIHAVADGIIYTDPYEFAKCDGLAIIRPNVGYGFIERACKYAIDQLGKEYDFWFNFDNENTYCCTELVYWSYKDVLPIKPKLIKKMFGTVQQEIISPDDFLTAEKCTLVWESSYCKKNRGA